MCIQPDGHSRHKFSYLDVILFFSLVMWVVRMCLGRTKSKAKLLSIRFDWSEKKYKRNVDLFLIYFWLWLLPISSVLNIGTFKVIWEIFQTITRKLPSMSFIIPKVDKWMYYIINNSDLTWKELIEPIIKQ